MLTVQKYYSMYCRSNAKLETKNSKHGTFFKKFPNKRHIPMYAKTLKENLFFALICASRRQFEVQSKFWQRHKSLKQKGNASESGYFKNLWSLEKEEKLLNKIINI